MAKNIGGYHAFFDHGLPGPKPSRNLFFFPNVGVPSASLGQSFHILIFDLLLKHLEEVQNTSP